MKRALILTAMIVSACGAGDPSNDPYASKVAIDQQVPPTAENAIPVEVAGAKAHQLGPLNLSMSKDDVLALGLPSRTEEVMAEEEIFEDLIVEVEPGVEIRVSFEEDDSVFRLSTSSPRVVAPGRGHVGMTFGELQALYPEADVNFGRYEGARFLTLSTGQAGVRFAIDPHALSTDCLDMRIDCPSDMSGYVSTSLFFG